MKGIASDLINGFGWAVVTNLMRAKGIYINAISSGGDTVELEILMPEHIIRASRTVEKRKKSLPRD